MEATTLIGEYFEIHRDHKTGVYYLKLRIYPTDEIVSLLNSSQPKEQILEDEFYDTEDHSFGKNNHYIRRRGNKIVRQECKTKDGMLIYLEQEINSLPAGCNSIPFLRYRFKRTISRNDDLYLDEIEIGEGDYYRMITISKSVIIQDKFASGVLHAVGEALLQFRLLPAIKNLEDIYKLLTNSSTYLPMPTKFMTMLQLSESADKYYEIYREFDPFCKVDHLDHLRELVKVNKDAAKRYYWSAFTRMDMFLALFALFLEENGNRTGAKEAAMVQIRQNFKEQMELEVKEFMFDELVY